MKDLFQEIRSQPPHIREIFMWACVVIVFSVVGFVWFRQTTKQFVALLHPEEAQERALAEAEQKKTKQPSPFATIFSTIGDLRANISELLAGPKPNTDVDNGRSAPEEQLSPQKLPISD